MSSELISYYVCSQSAEKQDTESRSCGKGNAQDGPAQKYYFAASDVCGSSKMQPGDRNRDCWSTGIAEWLRTKSVLFYKCLHRSTWTAYDPSCS